MLQKRRIQFKANALSDPNVSSAVIREGITEPLVPDPNGIIDTFDQLSDLYPKLCAALDAGNWSYNVYRQRDGEGDHTFWYQHRNGVMTCTNFGQVEAGETPPIDIREMSH